MAGFFPLQIVPKFCNLCGVLPDDIKARMDAVERLTNIARIERLVYLTSAISLAILLTSTAVFLVNRSAGTIKKG